MFNQENVSNVMYLLPRIAISIDFQYVILFDYYSYALTCQKHFYVR